MEKRKKLIWLSAALALVLLLLLLRAFWGDPLTKWIAQKNAEEYLETNFENTEYQLEDLRYSFKDGRYQAAAVWPGSPDRQFSIFFSGSGKLSGDSFDDVSSGFNTYRRVDLEYRRYMERGIDDPAFPVDNDFCFATLEFCYDEQLEDPSGAYVPPYAQKMSSLELDKEYDPGELGRLCGHMVLYLDSEDISPAKGAEVLLAVKEHMDRAGLSFAAIDLHLRYPKDEKGERREGELSLRDFPYDDISSQSLSERVAEAHEQCLAYYAAEKK